jgi:4'-phosphopantetheinyl transferase EntD
VGSIAHTRRDDRGFCGAAVARTTSIRSLGLDVEVDTPLERKLWRRILVPNETAWISEHAESDRGFWAMLVFSAKECVYKCQHPLSRTFLEFADVEVERPMNERDFAATLLRDAGPFSRGSRFTGRFVRRQGLIATGITLRN